MKKTKKHALTHFTKGQRVMLIKKTGAFFPVGAVGTIVEDVTGHRVGRQDQIVPLGHVYRVVFDHRDNMPATYVWREHLAEVIS